MRSNATSWLSIVALASALSGCSGAGASTAAAGPSAIDIGFCQDMTAHHGQAILMSENVIGRASPRVRTIAIAILGGQAEEAGMMKGWLQLWGASQLSSAPMAWMRDASGDAHAMNGMGGMNGMGAMGAMSGGGGSHMPGMASQAELATMASEHGKPLDVTFLQLMIRHHEAGIVMAEYAQAHAKSDLVRGAAAEMAVDQMNENVLMRHLLAADGAAPLRMN